MQSSIQEQLAFKQNFVNPKLNYVSCIRITQIANKPEAIYELKKELESSQFKYGPLVSFRVIDNPIRNAPNTPTYRQTTIAFAQFKYTISNYLAIKEYHNLLFHGYHLQFQMAGETDLLIDSSIIIRREYISKTMVGIPYRHTDPFTNVKITPSHVTHSQLENVIEQSHVDPPAIISETSSQTLEPTGNAVEPNVVKTQLIKWPLNVASQTDITQSNINSVTTSDLKKIHINPCSSVNTRSDCDSQPPISHFIDFFNSRLMKVIVKAAGVIIDDEENKKHRQASRCIYCLQIKTHDMSHPHEIGRHQRKCFEENLGLPVSSVDNLIKAIGFIKQSCVETPLERMMRWECPICMSDTIECTKPNKKQLVRNFVALYCGHVFCTICFDRLVGDINKLPQIETIVRTIKLTSKSDLRYFTRCTSFTRMEGVFKCPKCRAYSATDEICYLKF